MNTANIAAASASGTQPPLGILVALPRTKARSTTRTARTPARCARRATARRPRGDGAEHRRDDHRADDRSAIGAGKGAGRPEDEHEGDDRDQHDRVGGRHVDLAALVGRGLQDLHARQQVQLDRLARDRKRARDRRLRGDDGRARREHAMSGRQRSAERARRTDCAAAGGFGKQQRTLAEVVEEQSRPHDREPGDPHRHPPEMTHVRVQRLAAGQHQEHGAEDRKRESRMRRQQDDGVHGTQRRQHAGLDQDRAHAEQPRARRTTGSSPARTAGRRAPCRGAAARTAAPGSRSSTGTIAGACAASSSSSPSTAPSTEMAGVSSASQ